MNTVDLLLKMDAGKIAEIPSREMEIKRLSDIAGEPFMVKVTAIAGQRFSELAGAALGDDGKVDFGRAYGSNSQIAVAGLVDPDLTNKDLQAHFKAATPKELLEKLFLGGEITRIADAITDLSGYGKDTEEKVKN